MWPEYSASMFVNNAPTSKSLSISRGVFFCLLLPLAIGFELTMLTTEFTGRGRDLHLVLLGAGVFGRLVNIGVIDGLAVGMVLAAGLLIFMIEVVIMMSLSQTMIDLATAVRGPYYVLLIIAVFAIGLFPGKSERN